jgi:DNA-binding response OmpR family regulator
MRDSLILIVDDDADFVAMLAGRFSSLGYRVLTALDGHAALKAFGRARPAVVLLDVHMPEVDGLLLLREMREREPDARIIAMSGLPDDRVAHLMLEEGACDFLVKPFDLAAAETSVSVNMIAAAGSLPRPMQTPRHLIE